PPYESFVPGPPRWNTRGGNLAGRARALERSALQNAPAKRPLDVSPPVKWLPENLYNQNHLNIIGMRYEYSCTKGRRAGTRAAEILRGAASLRSAKRARKLVAKNGLVAKKTACGFIPLAEKTTSPRSGCSGAG
ncbi:MAG: hypothetical protein K5985_06145, partial [Lachnospiraceae bacterium]|nr:hypothetical protein [Lachnospiraceae bacterium]